MRLGLPCDLAESAFPDAGSKNARMSQIEASTSKSDAHNAAPTVTLLHDLHADLAEGPTWDERIQRLYFVDIDKQKIYSCSEDGSDLFEIDTHETVGTIALTTDKNILLAAMNRYSSRRSASVILSSSMASTSE